MMNERERIKRLEQLDAIDEWCGRIERRVLDWWDNQFQGWTRPWIQ